MKLQINSLHWDNYNPDMLQAHKDVMEHLDIKVNYHQQKLNHGIWMDHVMKTSKADVVGFIEPDCIPITKQIVLDAAKYAYDNKSFVGIAQVANHLGTKSHIYAAPAFYFIHKECWDKMGQPTFRETLRADVAEEVTYRAEELGIRYRTYYPDFFEREPEEGLWPLGSYGYYGVGTVFHNSIYHLYQGRMGNNAELYVQRCKDVINGNFSTVGFYSSKTFNYNGRVVP